MRREALHLPGKMTSAEKSSNLIALAAFLASGLSLYYTSCEGPKLRIGIAQQAFLNAKPRIGLLANIQNDGAKAGTFIGGELLWDSVTLRLVMTSPRLDSWTYTDKGKMKEVEKTTFTFVFPAQIQGHSSQPAALWFSREEGANDRLFTSGKHLLEVRLFDGVQTEPVVKRSFSCSLEAKDVANVYSPGSETSEFTVPLTLKQ